MNDESYFSYFMDLVWICVSNKKSDLNTFHFNKCRRNPYIKITVTYHQWYFLSRSLEVHIRESPYTYIYTNPDAIIGYKHFIRQTWSSTPPFLCKRSYKLLNSFVSSTINKATTTSGVYTWRLFDRVNIIPKFLIFTPYASHCIRLWFPSAVLVYPLPCTF